MENDITANAPASVIGGGAGGSVSLAPSAVSVVTMTEIYVESLVEDNTVLNLHHCEMAKEESIKGAKRERSRAKHKRQSEALHEFKYSEIPEVRALQHLQNNPATAISIFGPTKLEDGGAWLRTENASPTIDETEETLKETENSSPDADEPELSSGGVSDGEGNSGSSANSKPQRLGGLSEKLQRARANAG
eukprot:FR737074.1.p2 GENE.FR737074.1~~FR737074.1.p2  ORF type:complete len:204 (+),score=32.30 FR737074.1:41-613(+)